MINYAIHHSYRCSCGLMNGFADGIQVIFCGCPMNEKTALTYALFKIYDNYITPLGTKVKCWKSWHWADGHGMKYNFIVGITIPQIDLTNKYITFFVDAEHWTKFNLIELERAPINEVPKDNVNNLLCL